MEVGEVFDYLGKRYRVELAHSQVMDDSLCRVCAFHGVSCGTVPVPCNPELRDDHMNVIFKEAKHD